MDRIFKVKFILGCEGGSSLFDPDGSIKEKVDSYIQKEPSANFHQIKQKFFSKEDYNLSLFALGPRHLEAILTGTLQILIEGKYNGVLIPNLHFFELKKDFSNAEEILLKISDLGNCERFVENARQDILQKENLRYSFFVKKIDQEIQNILEIKPKNHILIKFLLKNFFHVRNSILTMKHYLKFKIKRLLTQFKFI